MVVVLDTRIWASKPAPARPRAIAWSGAGAATTVSQARQRSFSRRTTLKRAAHVIQGLGHVLADPAQAAAAMREGAGGRVQHLFPRQRLGNGRRAGFCASTAVSTMGATAGAAVASRSAGSVSTLSIASAYPSFPRCPSVRCWTVSLLSLPSPIVAPTTVSGRRTSPSTYGTNDHRPGAGWRASLAPTW